MAAALLRNCPETHFVFVGEDGPLRVEAEQYVEDLAFGIVSPSAPGPTTCASLWRLWMSWSSTHFGRPAVVAGRGNVNGKADVATDIPGSRS